MKPQDLDDLEPVAPDAELLVRVHTRSRAFRKHRTTQRIASVTTGVIVLALAGGIALTRVDATDHHPTGAINATTTTTPGGLTEASIRGTWHPVSIAGYAGPLTKPPLSWRPRLSFNGRGRYTGSDGCNDIGGTYRIEAGGKLHFLTFGGTLVGCLGKTPDFDPILSAQRIELRNDHLTFLAAGGEEIASFASTDVIARIELPAQTMTAGSSMEGHVVVDNYTGHPLHHEGCGPLFHVALANDQLHPDLPLSPLCLMSLSIPVGTTSYPVVVSAEGVPPGDYNAIAFQQRQVVPAPRPIPVHVEPNDSARLDG